jgi:organic radical activating enzyme
MPDFSRTLVTPLRRTLRRMTRRVRMARMIALGVAAKERPILAQIIPIRRCNLACTYCNEFDKVSAPVPLDEMLRRIDRLADLGTLSVDLSGGEPLLHPDLDAVIARIRARGMLASLLTNGYLLSRARIERLNRAGLDRLQISIDNVVPDDVSYKSLKVLDQKLQLLARHAEFDVSINSVLGSGVKHPSDALTIAQRALTLGFGTSVGVIHDGDGQIAPLNAEARTTYESIARLGRGFYTHAHDGRFQRNLIDGRPNEWQCRAGARYLYICEDGLVHWCSQQRGYPGTPLRDYTEADLAREFSSTKSCAPTCTVSCVHRVSLIDDLRERPAAVLDHLSEAHRLRGGHPPASVAVLRWMFLTGRPSHFFRRLALRATRPDARA